MEAWGRVASACIRFPLCPVSEDDLGAVFDLNAAHFHDGFAERECGRVRGKGVFAQKTEECLRVDLFTLHGWDILRQKRDFAALVENAGGGVRSDEVGYPVGDVILGTQGHDQTGSLGFGEVMEESGHIGGNLRVQPHKGAVEEQDLGTGGEGLGDAGSTGLAVAEIGDGHVEERTEVELVDDFPQRLRFFGGSFVVEGVEFGVAGEIVMERIIRLLPSGFISRTEICSPHPVPAHMAPSIRIEPDILDGIVRGSGQIGQMGISPRMGRITEMATAEDLQKIRPRQGRR